MSAARRLAAVIAGDVVGYSRLLAADDRGTVELLGRCRAAVEASVAAEGGRLADFRGDNFLAEFPGALRAARAALAIQSAVGALCADLEPAQRLRLRLGIDAGDVSDGEGGALYGDCINVAARLESAAPSGGICVTDFVRRQIARRLPVRLLDLGERALKNLPEPVRIYRLEPVRDASRASVDAPRGAIRALAVLPLANLSGDPSQEPFADSLTDSLIRALSGLSSLRVVSRTSVQQYKGATKPLPDIAHELGVEAVVEGSVLREGEQVRVSVQLIDALHDQHLWSEQYDRHLQGILALQNEIARSVARQVRLELTPRERARLEGPLERWLRRLGRRGLPED